MLSLGSFCNLCGAVLILLATVGGFGQLRLALRQRPVELAGWLAAVRLLQSEMNYGLLPLPRLCELAAGQIDGVVGTFWRLLADELAAQPAQALPELWQRLLAQQEGGWHLLAADQQVLSELGLGLGASGLANQQRLLALTERRLQKQEAEAAEGCARWTRLLGGLGWCSGLLLICLWL